MVCEGSDSFSQSLNGSKVQGSRLKREVYLKSWPLTHSLWRENPWG